jgi:ketosteroid isomerase-like protein
MSSQTDTRTQVERFRKGYDNFGKGDLEAIREDFAPNIIWHVGGHNSLTGDYQGIDDVFALFGRIFTETEGSLKNEVHDILANEVHGVAMIKTTAARSGKRLETNQVHIVHYDGEGRVTESWLLPEKAAEADDFWS